MKTRFNTYDIVCSVAELQKLVGLRVNQCYDIDNKTYLIRFQEKDSKTVLLLESGFRFHTTEFEWPKNMAPSGFTMKLRKHLKNKRLEKLEQLGLDRIIDMQFGTGEVAFHVIVELYDRGNIILTDNEMTILNVLRPHVEGEEVRFAVREKYPESRARESFGQFTEEELAKTLRENGKAGDYLKRVLNPILSYGTALIEHILLKYDLAEVKLPSQVVEEPAVPIAEDEENNKNKSNKKNKAGGGKNQKPTKRDANARVFNYESDVKTLLKAINEATEMIRVASVNRSKGYIIQKQELKPSSSAAAADSGEKDYFYHNIEYHPYLFEQYKSQPHKEFDSFDVAVDEFYSHLEGQKIDVKALQQERDALKKLSNVKKDHEKRLEDLTKVQLNDRKKAELITRNQVLVDNAILAIRSAIANQLSWPDIHDLVKSAQANGDQVASSIKQLKLESNHISLYLTDPFGGESDDDTDDGKLESMVLDIDLALSAYSNATRFYDQKRNAAKKEQRTIESSTKALKSAERKTQQTLKEVRSISTISKARKVFWFEKFYWFISTENYLVIGGRDQQQNDLIVKRYLRPNDIYVHAEIQGASSVVIRNPTEKEIPPKTLLEAGAMAISYSVAWDAKVVTTAYWVKSDQVSKTAQTGEYLGTGSFVIRGKKNFLPACHLVLGLSFLFKLEESSVARHAGERRVRNFQDGEEVDDTASVFDDKLDDIAEEVELDASSEDENAKKDSDDDEGVHFPDTHIKIEHKTESELEKTDKILKRLKTESISEEHSTADDFLHDDEAYIIHAPAARLKQTNKKKDRQLRKGKKVQVIVEEEEEPAEKPSEKSNQLKRGQKSKLKKIKEKYKDQDEEDRRIRMDILKSAGSGKVTVVAKPAVNKSAAEATDEVEKEKFADKKPKPIQNTQLDDDVDDTPGGDDAEVLDSLTGLPVEEDEILFAVPVIAPYQALANYKFKVKLTPGTGRRGKAAKTALQMFIKEKSCTTREKDLLRGVKDEAIARNIPGKGYIIQKQELKPSSSAAAADSGEKDYFYHNIEYHPYLFEQYKSQPHKEFDSFDVAVDEFYSHLEGQKIDVKALQQERDALKKLSNVKKDHEKRLEDLTKVQLNDRKKAELITRNQVLVDNAILAIRSAIANQLSWPDIHDLVKSAQANGDQVASSIKQLKLESNHISLYLTDPFGGESDDDTDDGKLESMVLDIDLALSAYSNATRFYDQKRNAAKKEQRTIESSTKALKSAERKTQQTLKEVRSISTISKARKVFWFEKFYWFISTENYLVIGGRDQQQNDLIVKRYLRPNDIYVHAEIQGASSVVIRNPTEKEIPPKTLLEAGAMAISYSVAWDAKVVTTAYWVKSDQVSKTAQTGEYLGTGSFVIRGKKNFLPACHLVLGLSFLFKLEESSVARHAGERRVRNFQDGEEVDDTASVFDDKLDDIAEEVELDASSEDENAKKDSDDDEGVHFPDTHIKIEHKTESELEKTDKILKRLKTESISEEHSTADDFLHDDEAYIIHAPAARLKQTNKKKDRQLRKGKKVQVIVEEEEEPAEKPSEKSNQLKRGQKSKLKKIKEKYKDQDEEDRRIRMDILKSAGSGKVTVVAKPAVNKSAAEATDEVEKEKFADKKPKPIQNTQLDDDVDDTPGGDDAEVLDSLTGLPVEEDEILFAVPVIAPYQALANYKFKVKLTPGTGRRGKAAKTALQMFIKEKSCTTREKDLLRGVKDEAIARNIPGKVKLSASQSLHKHKK